MAARRRAGDVGASLVEYALLLALIAVACFAAARLLGQSVNDRLSDTGSRLEAGVGASGP